CASPCAFQRNSADIPGLNPAEKYYVGILNQANNAQIAVNTVFLAFITPWIPPPSTPAIDTSGFFGPIIRALITIATIAIQELLLAFSFIAGVIITALNAMGNFFGLGNIGTNLSNF